jgi:Cu-Zn family superoxide dismutase
VLGAAADSGGTKVELKDTQGQPVGTAILSSARSGGVAIALDLKNLPPGRHGIHFHQTAMCEAPAFESAGPHYNPESKKHGLFNPEGPHAGDVNNFTVGKDGKAKTSLVAARMTLDHPSALVVHAQADDLKTDPSGNSGDRVAVGPQHVVVFTQREPRPVGLDPAGRDDGGRLASLHRVPDIHPCHLFQPDRVGRRQRIRCVDAVVRVLGALPAAGAARILHSLAAALGRRRGARLLG